MPLNQERLNVLPEEDDNEASAETLAFIDSIICETCLFSEQCYGSPCIAAPGYRENMRKDLLAFMTAQTKETKPTAQTTRQPPKLKTLDPTNLQKKLEKVGYFANDKISSALSASMILGKPLLIEGAPGVGKTSLAKAVAAAMDMPLIRLQMYEGLTDDKILYDYDYQKQLLSLEAAKPAFEKQFADMNAQTAIETAASQVNFFGRDFMIERPILRSINGDGRKVLLIDEIDKAPEETEYMLYEFFENYEISIPQYGTITCPPDQRPIVFLTSNGYRELSQAFRRRCTYLYIPEKTVEEMTMIIQAKAGVDEKLAQDVATCLTTMARSSIRQKPSVAEGVDWAAYLAQNPNCTKEFVVNSLGIIIKNQKDMKAATSVVQKMWGGDEENDPSQE